ncbi:MAG: restriction endonuclease subunit S [Collinsella sp.]|nr:restriction endonuclease subunit S [Collinsella sp.]
MAGDTGQFAGARAAPFFVLRGYDIRMVVGFQLNGYLVKACDVLYSNYTAGEQAAEWPMGTLEDLLEIRYGKDHKKLNDGNIPVYGSGGYMRSVDRFLYSGESVLVPRKGSLNNVMYVREKFWTVDTMFYAVPKSPNVAKYAYQFIKRLDLASMNSGSAVPSMTTKILNVSPRPFRHHLYCESAPPPTRPNIAVRHRH